MPTNWDEFQQYYDPANTRKPKAATTKDPWWKKWLDTFTNFSYMGYKSPTKRPTSTLDYYSTHPLDIKDINPRPLPVTRQWWQNVSDFGYNFSQQGFKVFKKKPAGYKRPADYGVMPPGGFPGTDFFDPYDPAGSPYLQSGGYNYDTLDPLPGGGGGGGGGYPEYPYPSYPSEPDRWYENMLYWNI